MTNPTPTRAKIEALADKLEARWPTSLREETCALLLAFAATLPPQAATTCEHTLDTDAPYDMTGFRCAKCGSWIDASAQAATVAEGKPTCAEINALPQRIRDYIAALETECDPAGTIRENFRLREENAGLRAEDKRFNAEITRLRADLTAMEDCKNTYATLAYEREQEVFKLRAELAEVKRECERLEKLVYVPGLLKCAKCGCSVISTNLHYPSGGFSADSSPKKCPNGCGPMWPVTERAAGNEMVDRCEAQQCRAEQAEAARDRFAAVIALHHSSNTDRRLALKSLPTYADEKAATDEAVAHHRAAQGGK